MRTIMLAVVLALSSMMARGSERVAPMMVVQAKGETIPIESLAFEVCRNDPEWPVFRQWAEKNKGRDLASFLEGSLYRSGREAKRTGDILDLKRFVFCLALYQPYPDLVPKYVRAFERDNREQIAALAVGGLANFSWTKLGDMVLAKK